MMSGMKYRGALIGCGAISGMQLRAWDQINEAKIVALCDLEYKRVKERSEEYEIPTIYTDYHTMLERETLDFVDIATGPESHLELVSAGAAKGLHILCQKPMASSLDEARKMVRLCDDAGVVFMVNENFRHQAWFRQIKVLLEDGALGKPFYACFQARTRASLPKPNFGDQPYFRDMPRLIVYESGVHYLDTARFLFGEAQDIYAHVERISPKIAGDDLAILLLTFDDVSCLVDVGWCSVPCESADITWYEARIEGTLGTIILRKDGVLTLHTDCDKRSWSFSEDTIFRSFVATQKHFIECLVSNKTPETSGEETIRTMALVFAAYQSAYEERVFKIDEILQG
jgi:predicted dehydrogenase